jgi:hypothetical protein
MQRFSYLQNWRRPSQADKPHDPVLTAEDEQFLQSVTAQPTEAEATLSLNGDENVHPPVNPSSTEAYNIPLPLSPVEEFKELGEEERRVSNAGVVRTDSKLSQVESTPPSDKKKGPWYWLRRRGTSWKKKVQRHFCELCCFEVLQDVCSHLDSILGQRRDSTSRAECIANPSILRPCQQRSETRDG